MTEKCDAIIRFGDDYGDNSTTFHCKLRKGHKGSHEETGNMGDDENRIPYILKWNGSSKNYDDEYNEEDEE
jgi:hypothetical protein